ncbi:MULTISPECIES: LytR/AlgR family response regulator transcription factor [Aquimarina]|uniref:Response regulator transcription factor n=1 Tax=Aquimarina algiphila TaxID=2047982 RepID=A0A554VHQ9_9FLAO|nr:MULTISPECIES: LytTR family DNA-binding domain-containing protein [Aquimarina]TSE07107.1 response regulator transcription factor [Aquimarina algiphila]
MNILILEDEIPAYEKLKLYLAEYFGTDFMQDWSRSVVEAKVLLSEHQYDLILSDIQLLDGIAFDLFDHINISSPIIFCTAYDTFLLDAFKTNGIAYILKPYSKEELSEALRKYETLIALPKHSRSLNKEVFKELKELITPENKQFLKRFVVKKGNGIKLIDTETISLIDACGDFCKITDHNGNINSISQTIGTLSDQLDPKMFFRINRSQIININHIKVMDSHSKNRLLIILDGIEQGVITSSNTTPAFRKWVQF